MRRKNQAVKMLLVGFSVCLLSACATNTVPLNPAAKNVEVFSGGMPLPIASCQLKGQVIVKTTHAYGRNHVTQNEIYALKNEALTLGANTVIITHNYMEYDNQPNTHFVVGTAFSCGSAIVPSVDVPLNENEGE